MPSRWPRAETWSNTTYVGPNGNLPGVTPHRIEELFKAIEAGAVSRVVGILEETPCALEAIGHHHASCRDKTPLMYALQCQKFTLVNLLIDRGADVRARMVGGPQSSVISLAARFVRGGVPSRDLLHAVGRLIDGGANPSEGLWPALHAHRTSPHPPELIALLLARGADPDTKAGNSGNTVRELVAINARLYTSDVLALFGLSPATA